MTLVKRNTAPHFPSVLDELLNTDWLAGRNTGNSVTSPAVNVMENDDAFKVEVAAPGIKKEDFNIELDNDLLTISSKAEKLEKTEEGNYTRKEFNYASFKRSFNLPDTVNTAEIKATYTDGILSIDLPKREEAKVQPARTISIE